MLNNAVKEVKNVYLLFLCPRSLLGLDSVCAKHYQLVTDMSASTIAFEMTLITMLLRNEYLFRKKNVLLKFS